MSDEPVDVIRPFGDEPTARHLVNIIGNKGRLKYGGPTARGTPSYTLGEDAFTRLAPDASIRDMLKLGTTEFANFNEPGKYKVNYVYFIQRKVKFNSKRLGFIGSVWNGRISSKSVSIELVQDKPTQAFKQFQSQVKNIVAKMPKEARKYWLSELKHPKNWSVKRQPFTKAFQRVDDTLTPKERKTLIFHGKLQELNRAGECWMVGHFSGFGNSLVGYLDAQSRRLVFVWLIPEG